MGKSDKADVASAIDAIGVGQYQLMVLFLGGGVYAAEGTLLLIVGLVAKGLVIEWDLSPLHAGAMGVVIFLGLTVGTSVGGVCCDQFGRRIPVLVTYSGIVTFLLLALLSLNLTTLLIMKFLLGCFMGFGLPAANAIVCEACPNNQRANIYSSTMVLFAVGQMYAAGVMWALSPELAHDELHWRMMLGVGMGPALVLFILSYFLLLESANWLVVNGREDEAKAVVEKMARINGKDLSFDTLRAMESESVDAGERKRLATKSPPTSEGEPPDEEKALLGRDGCAKWVAYEYRSKKRDCDVMFNSRIRAIFTPQYRLTTTIMTYVCFCSNLSYYGMIYGLPHTFKRLGDSDDPEESWTPAAGVFFGALFEVPGVFLAVLLCTTISRKTNLTFAFGMSACLLTAVSYAGYQAKMDEWGVYCIFGSKMFIASGFIVAYLYLLEVYPTICRATGLAFCMVTGRIGALCCPIVYDGLYWITGSYVPFFLTLAIVIGTAAVMIVFLPYETKDQKLADV